MEDNESNVKPFRVISGNTPDEDLAPAKLPSEYYIQDIDGREYVREGWCVFTAQHVAIMNDGPDGAIPVLVFPLARIRVCELITDDGEFESDYED